MDKDFDFEDEHAEFDELQDIEDGDEIEGFFDDFDELEPDEVNIRTAILSKNNMIALLCVKTADQGGAICRVDPRESTPSVQIYDDPAKAIEWFNKSLRSSRRNGWQLVYDGLPLQG